MGPCRSAARPNPRVCAASRRERKSRAPPVTDPRLMDVVKGLLAQPTALHGVPPTLFGRALQKCAQRRHYPDAPGFLPAVDAYIDERAGELALQDAARAMWACAALQLPLTRSSTAALAARVEALACQGGEPVALNTSCTLLWSAALLDCLTPGLLRGLAAAVGASYSARDAGALHERELRALRQADALAATVLHTPVSLRALLPVELMGAADAAWAARGSGSSVSALQRSVHGQLLRLGLPAELEPGRRAAARAAVQRCMDGGAAGVELELGRRAAAQRRADSGGTARGGGAGGGVAAGAALPRHAGGGLSGGVGAAAVRSAPSSAPSMADAAVDIAIELPRAAHAGGARGACGPRVRVAIEVDGPTHYSRNAAPDGSRWQLGGSVARDALLAADGWHVVVVPHYEWERLEGWERQQEYLRAALRGASIGV